MITLTRLLELAGVRRLLEMSEPEAEAVFGREGYNARSMDKDALRDAWVQLQRRYHEGGSTPNPTRIAAINGAYDTLKNRAQQPVDSEVPDASDPVTYQVWGWDGRLFTKGFTVQCPPTTMSELPRMANERLRQGFRRPKAILIEPVSPGGRRSMTLIAVDGRPVPHASHGVIADPGQDPVFRSWLQAQVG